MKDFLYQLVYQNEETGGIYEKALEQPNNPYFSLAVSRVLARKMGIKFQDLPTIPEDVDEKYLFYAWYKEYDHMLENTFFTHKETSHDIDYTYPFFEDERSVPFFLSLFSDAILTESEKLREIDVKFIGWSNPEVVELLDFVQLYQAPRELIQAEIKEKEKRDKEIDSEIIKKLSERK